MNERSFFLFYALQKTFVKVEKWPFTPKAKIIANHRLLSCGGKITCIPFSSAQKFQ
jgi:hypothetical protein